VSNGYKITQVFVCRILKHVAQNEHIDNLISEHIVHYNRWA